MEQVFIQKLMDIRSVKECLSLYATQSFIKFLQEPVTK
jgi:hypothetical protein